TGGRSPSPMRQDQSISTVHRRRVNEKRKRSKKSEDLEDLVYRMKTLYGLHTPQRWRESLASGIHRLTYKLWEERRKIGLRALNWTTDTVWAKLPTELNPKVRSSLLLLGACLIDTSFYFYRFSIDPSSDATVSVLEQDLTRKEREYGLRLMSDLLDSGTPSDACIARVIRMAMRTIREHCANQRHSDRVMRRTVGCMRQALDFDVMPSPLTELVDDEVILPYIFDGLMNAEGRLKRNLCSLLVSILYCAQPVDRVTLVVRFHAQLKQSFHILRFRELAHFTRHSEFAGIVATTPTLLHRLFEHLQQRPAENIEWWRKFDFDDYCEIAIDVMDNLIGNDDSLLQQVMGYGFLSAAASNFASNRFDLNALRVASFRRILASHPEWRSTFRSLTYQGPEGNLTAELGRSIREVPKRSEDYVVTEEECESL
ncbi:hypothetical protein PFISCL1PPCAC_18902, partial [Pristionchus fissidentatus]